jgi:hypothetical protein
MAACSNDFVQKNYFRNAPILRSSSFFEQGFTSRLCQSGFGFAVEQSAAGLPDFCVVQHTRTGKK